MNDDEKKEGGLDESSKRVKVYLDSNVILESPSLRASLNKVMHAVTPEEIEFFLRGFGPSTDKPGRGSDPIKSRPISLQSWVIVWLETIFVFTLWFRWKQRARAASIKQPPGSRLLKLTDFFCSPKTMRLTVNPLVADWRMEYFDALKEGREWKARWISVRYYCAFGKALALDKVLALLKAASSAFSGG